MANISPTPLLPSAVYDRSLRNRGDIPLRFSEDAIQAWGPMHNGKQGRPQRWSIAWLSLFAFGTVIRVLPHWNLRFAVAANDDSGPSLHMPMVRPLMLT